MICINCDKRFKKEDAALLYGREVCQKCYKNKNYIFKTVNSKKKNGSYVKSLDEEERMDFYLKKWKRKENANKS